MIVSVSILTAVVFGVAFLIKEGVTRAGNLGARLDQARVLGIATTEEELDWPTETPAADNAWPDYVALRPEVQAYVEQIPRMRAYLLYAANQPLRERISPDLLKKIDAASHKRVCAWKFDWGKSVALDYALLIRLSMLTSVSAVEALHQNNIELAKARTLTTARIARQVTQGVVRDSMWAQERCETRAIRAACRVVEKLPPDERVPFLKEVLATFGEPPNLLRPLRGELLRSFARIDKNLKPLEAWIPGLSSGSQAMKDATAEAFIRYLSKVDTEPDGVRVAVKVFQEMDKAEARAKLLQHILPKQLDDIAALSASCAARRRMLQAAISKLQGMDTAPKDPFDDGPLDHQGFVWKSKGPDGKFGSPHDFDIGPQHGDDPILILNLTVVEPPHRR
jgi:hypothetical protein